MIRTRIVETSLWPKGRYIAITLFGLVFCRDRRNITPRVLNHELIHCAQQLEWLYLPFFIIYGAEWCWRRWRAKSNYEAYRNISFEREAYAHEGDGDYLGRRKWMATFRKDYGRRR